MVQTAFSGSKRNGTLDLLRFLAVLFIFFGHYTDTFNYIYQIVPSNLHWNVFSRYASLALLIFFMVSGYVVTMTSVNRNLKDFIISRTSRIYPLFWISCIVAFFLPKMVNHSFLAVSSFKTFLVNLTMVPTVFREPLINQVFHTLITEIAFYIFIGVIIFFKLWRNILLITAILLGYSFAFSFGVTMPAHTNLVPLLAGMLFYFISINYSERWKLYTLLCINFCCALLLARPLSIKLNQLYLEPGMVNAWILRLGITFIYFIFLMIALKKLHIKSRPLLIILGEIAYAFYLFHLYFLVLYYHFRNSI